MNWSIPCRASAASAIAIAVTSAAGAPTGHAINGDAQITGEGLEQTIDCNGATLLMDGTGNTVNAVGTADNVIHDITVYGAGESVFYKNSDPVAWDRGRRELGMVNRISHVGS